MVGEPTQEFSEAEESPHAERPEEEPVEKGDMPVDSLESFVQKHRFGFVLRPVLALFPWLFAGKVRISVAVGIFAGLIVTLGFVLFDAWQEEYMLKYKYPKALSSYERHVLHARDLVLRKQYAKAEPILRKLVEKRAGTGLHANALLLHGECLDSLARDPEAAKAARGIYNRFITEYPANPRVPSAHMRFAESLARSGLYGESNARCKKLLRMLTDPEKSGEVELLIALNHYRARELARSIDLLEQVQQKYSGTALAQDSTLLLAQAFGEFGRPEDAESVLRHLIGETPGTPHAVVALQMLAKNALDAGAHEDAIRYCTQWLKESPLAQHQVDVMLTLGLAKLAAGAPAAAWAVASDIVTHFPDSPRRAEAIILQGKSLEARGQIEKAEISYLEAARISTDDPSPRKLLARLYLSKGDLPKAIEQAKYASEAAPHKDALYIELAKLYRLNGENVKALEVLGEFTRERQLSKFIGDAYLMMVDIQLELGRPREAYDTLDRLFATGTATVGRFAVSEKQADILAQVGLYDDAVETYRLALETGANTAVITPKIAKILLAEGKIKQCLDELASAKASALTPSEKFDFIELEARAYLGLEMFEEARRAIYGAIALHTGREKFSTLALLMQADLALEDDRAALNVFEVTLKLIENDNAEAPPEARRIILDWAGHLYEEGKYAQAGKAYSYVDSPEFPVTDVAWATYQEGNCYYHMTEYEKAREAYSRLANEFSGSDWVTFAEQKQRMIVLMTGT